MARSSTTLFGRRFVHHADKKRGELPRANLIRGTLQQGLFNDAIPVVSTFLALDDVTRANKIVDKE